MNPPDEISPSTLLVIDEMRRLFAEHDAKWDRRFADLHAARPGDIVPVHTLVTSTVPDASFDADRRLIRCGSVDIEYTPASDSLCPVSEKGVSILTTEAPGLTEEHDYEPAIFDSTSPLPMVEQLVIDAAAPEYTSIDLDAYLDPLLCDRLSILPDALLCNIVSRLPLRDAARTAVLSRRWWPLCADQSKSLVRSDPRRDLDPGPYDVLRPRRFREVGVVSGAVSADAREHLSDPAHEDSVVINDFDQINAGLLCCVRLVPAMSVLRVVPIGGYDGSLDDDPEFGFAHLDASLDQDVSRGCQALAAAVALRTDAVGAAGGGLLAWEMAAGSSQATCSTVCPAGHTIFGDIPNVVLWEEMLQLCIGHRCLNLHPVRADAVPEAMRWFLVDTNQWLNGSQDVLLHGTGDLVCVCCHVVAEAVPEDALMRFTSLVLRHACDIYAIDDGLKLSVDEVALALAQSAAASVDAVDALPTPDVTRELASLGARQVFEVLSLHADLFCNICIG